MPRPQRSPRAGLAPVELAAKEGLALVNGTQGDAAVGTWRPVRWRTWLGRPTSRRR